MMPKAIKYRIRRHAPIAAGRENAARALDAAPAEQPTATGPEGMFDTHDDGFGDRKFPTAATSSDADEIAAIRAEGLGGRQLRLARRMAQRHGLRVASDFEAVLKLRRKGVDPFDRANILAMVTEGTQETEQEAQSTKRGIHLPQKIAPSRPPATEVRSADQRAGEILRMQRDIARRRRRRLAMLFMRLCFFVFLPTLVAGWYYAAIATPLYATKTEFVIQKADGVGAGAIGGLFSGTQFATSQDSITVQSYLQSRDAMLRLDADQGFRAHYSEPAIDPLNRLEPGASNEETYKRYQKSVKIGYDPTEGIVKMEVIATDPETSRRFSESLISYAEEQVDHLTQRLRGDQMQGARENYADAEAKVFAAQAKVLELQEKVGILDPVSESNVVMGQVSGLETQVQRKRLELGQLLDNPSPNMARVEGVQGDIARLERLIRDLRSTLTQNETGTGSLASISGQLRIAEAELETRQMLLSGAAQQLESARIEANKQVRYLEMGVRPIPPDEPTYPRAFENTLLAFLIFSGIYLMLSLTASILREQVSS